MDGLSEQQIQRISQLITTEHFTLQGARNATISEANGRLGHYLSTVGSSVVALAFVANVSGMGQVFIAFASVILPVMIVLGVVTFIRTLQIGVDFFRITQAINRIRHYYIDVAPEAEPYLSFPWYDDTQSVQQSMRPFNSPLQGLASTPGPIILINSVLTGAFAGILSFAFFAADFRQAILIALAAGIIGFVLHNLYGKRLWQQSGELDIRFPKPDQA